MRLVLSFHTPELCTPRCYCHNSWSCHARTCIAWSHMDEGTSLLIGLCMLLIYVLYSSKYVFLFCGYLYLYKFEKEILLWLRQNVSNSSFFCFYRILNFLKKLLYILLCLLNSKRKKWLHLRRNLVWVLLMWG